MESVQEEIFHGELPQVHSLGECIFDPVWAQTLHSSSHCEMYHILTGRVQLELNGTVVTGGPGDTLLIPPHTQHRDQYDLNQGLRVVMVFFSWSAAEAFFQRVDNRVLLTLPEAIRLELSDRFRQLSGDLRGGGVLDRLVIRAGVAEILMRLLREAGQGKENAEQDHLSHACGQRLMQQAKKYVDCHYAQCITLDSIAADLRISSFYLSHLFSRESGFSLFSYITMIRMQQAVRLLRDERLSIAEVAYAVGYEHPSYFSRVFKRQYGLAPGLWRKKNTTS